jgi:hypothetical protein
MEGTTKYAKGAKTRTQIVFKSNGQAIGPIDELWTLSENRTRAVRKPNPFALLACFVVEKEEWYLINYH